MSNYLSTLFIILESYLLGLEGWKAGDDRPGYKKLKKTVLKLPASSSRKQAHQIISIIYDYYQAATPPNFLFNRHGLLHGLRGRASADRMNCVRMFALFDLLCAAEGIQTAVVIDDEFKLREEVYRECRNNGNERILLNLSEESQQVPARNEMIGAEVLGRPSFYFAAS